MSETKGDTKQEFEDDAESSEEEQTQERKGGSDSSDDDDDAAKKASEEVVGAEPVSAGSKKRKLVFRNYVPRTKKLQDFRLKEHSVIEEQKLWVGAELDKILSSKPLFTQDLLSIAPKKPTWDLHRDIKGKLEELERRTKKAMQDIIRTKVEEQKKAEGSSSSDDDSDDEDAPSSGKEAKPESAGAAGSKKAAAAAAQSDSDDD